MDIYLDASLLGIFPPLFTSPSGDSCIVLLAQLIRMTNSKTCPTGQRYAGVIFQEDRIHSGKWKCGVIVFIHETQLIYEARHHSSRDLNGLNNVFKDEATSIYRNLCGLQRPW